MAEWHAAAIDRFVERTRAEPGSRGVVLVGSVARGEDRPDSDVDLYLVVDDAEFERAAAAGRIAFVDRAGIEDRHGYLDVKLVSPSYLREGAEAGDDPLRASFVGARVLWDAGDDLPELVGAILAPDGSYFSDLENAFVAQVALHGRYFLPQALELGKPLLAHHAAIHAAYAAGRLVLAHDGVFFRGAKYLDAQLAASRSTPPNLVQLLEDLVAHPTVARTRKVETVLAPLVPNGFDISDEVLSAFITDNELGWRTRRSPPEFR